MILSKVCSGCLQSPKPVILVGPQAKPFKAIESTINLANKTQYATAVIPNAKVIRPS